MEIFELQVLRMPADSQQAYVLEDGREVARHRAKRWYRLVWR
jgi:hypothetical protein